MIQENFIKLYEHSFRENWDLPCYTNYGENEMEREPSLDERYSVYAHMALGGFLWSLWAVYKASLGEEFGEYTIIMYRYAKHFYKKCRDIG